MKQIKESSNTASPVPTLPAASVARTTRTWVPGLRSGVAIVIVSRGVSNRPSSGKTGTQSPPSRA